MSDNQHGNHPETMAEAYDAEGVKKVKWSAFVEGQLADFFTGYKLEKMTVEDGFGNKAKLTRTKDNAIKVEQSSTTLL
jgi:hypothetical protein